MKEKEEIRFTPPTPLSADSVLFISLTKERYRFIMINTSEVLSDAISKLSHLLAHHKIRKIWIKPRNFY